MPTSKGKGVSYISKTVRGEPTKYYKDVVTENLPGTGRIETRFAGAAQQITPEEYNANRIPDYRPFTSEEIAQGHAQLDSGVQIPLTNDYSNYNTQTGGRNVQVPGQPQQMQQQPQQKQAGILAKIGVTPAVLTANLISKGLKLLSGGRLDLGTQSVQEFANRPIGHILGLATTGAAAVAGGMALAPALGIGGGTTATTAGVSTETLAAETTLPNVIKGVLAKNYLTIGKFELTGAKILIGGYAGYEGLSNKIQMDAKRAIASSRTSLVLTIEGYKIGAISYQEASSVIDELEIQINKYDRGAKMWGTFSILEKLGASKDARVDAENARKDVLISRQQLNQAVVNQRMGK